jgi:xanthine/uracil permease
MLGIGPGSRASADELIVSVITLATIIGVAIWGRPGLRALAVLVGVVTGCVSFGAISVFSGSLGAVVSDIAFVAPQWPLAQPTFPVAFMPGFLIGALACFIRAIADITTCQQLANPDWKARARWPTDSVALSQASSA